MPSTTGELAESQNSASPEQSATTRIDVGRLIGVPVMFGLLLLNAMSLVNGIRSDGLAWTYSSLGSVATSALTISLYALLISAFMRRSPAKATHPSPMAAVAAGLATWLPFAIPLLPHGEASEAGLIAATTLLVLGLGFAVWAIRYLDRSFSMIAQARAVVSTGPYAVVRHPLYTGELAGLLGTVLVHPGVWTLTAWLAILCLQAYRVRHEEAILAATLEDYREYQRSTPQLIPVSISRLLRRR